MGLAGLAGLLTGAVLAGVVAWNWNAAPRPNVTRFEIALPESDRFSYTGRHAVALSPDGTQLVYSANQQLYLRSMDEMEATPIRGTEGDGRSPFFSPDGEWVGFWSDGKLQKVPITGGAPVTLCDAENPYGASWGADGNILFGQGTGGIFRVPASGGEPEVLIEVSATDGELALSPELLPGGEAVLFTLAPGVNWDEAEIVAHSLETGEREVLVEGGADARYVATGHLVYALGESLFAVPFHPSRSR